MTRFSLGIPTVALVVGLGLTAQGQSVPQGSAPAESAVPAQTAPSASPTPATPVSPAPAPASPAETNPTAPAPIVPAPVVPAPAAPAAPVDASPAPSAPVTPGDAPAATPAADTPAADTPTAPPSEAAPVAPAPASSDLTAPSQGEVAAAPPSVTPVVPVEGGTALPSAHDLSPLGMYQQADLVVKSVMILLAAACFVTWTVLFYKLVETAVARARARNAALVLTRAASLATAVSELKGRRDPGAFMAHAVAEEFRRSSAAIDPSGPEGIKERAGSLVHRVEVQAAARLRRGMGLLATIGSVAPFVGLFGTVWGIMNSFIGIAETQTTNLAVVAPGIAEALFATALGLVAAIPAVVIYNHFTRVIQGYKQTLGDASAATQRLLSRDIDFRHLEG